MASQIPPEELIAMQQNIHDDKRVDQIVCYGFNLGIALFAVISRFVSRRIGKVGYGLDDWAVLAALVCCQLAEDANESG